MAKIAHFHAPFESHLGLAVRLGSTVRRSGHRVVAWAAPEVRAGAELGADEVREDVHGGSVWPALRGMNRPPGSPGGGLAPAVALEEAAVAALAPLSDVLIRDGIDLVIADVMAPWGALAARWLNLPLVTYAVANTLNAGGGEQLATSDPDLRERLGRAHAVGASMRRMRRAPDPPWGDRTLMFTAPGLTGPEVRHPSVRFVGPLPGPPDAHAAAVSPIRSDAGGARVRVLMALGTLRTDRPGLLSAAMTALATEPVELLVATGERFPAQGLGDVPANATLQPRVDQVAELERAAVFISHAGLNSVLEAMLAGVPTLCAPGGGDQPAGARRVAAIGAGLVLTREQPDEIRAAVRELLADPRYRTAAAAAGAELRALDGAAVVDRALTELLAGR